MSLYFESGASDYSGFVRRYHHTPKLMFRHGVNDKSCSFDVANSSVLSILPFVGFELELEHDTECLDELYKYARWTLESTDAVYIKQDSSLVNGFEVVSHPGVPGYWLLEHDWTWLENLREWGFHHAETGISGEGGAMHFHVNRKAFVDDAHILRFEKTMLGLDWIVAEGLAVDTPYAERKPQGIGALENEKINKYRWVRPTRNTVEVRCFRGSMDKMGVLLAMQIISEAMNVSKGEVF